MQISIEFLTWISSVIPTPVFYFLVFFATLIHFKAISW